MIYIAISSFLLTVLNVLLAGYAGHYGLWFSAPCVALSLMFGVIALYSLDDLSSNRL